MSESDELYHYGTPRHSGRYPWGSGENPYQHEPDFMSHVAACRKDGMSDTDIAHLNGMSLHEMQKKLSNEKLEKRTDIRSENAKLISEGITNRSERARRLGVAESTLRDLEKSEAQKKDDIRNATVQTLKDAVDKHTYIDVGVGVGASMGISETRFRNAVAKLESEGYERHQIKVEQATNPGRWTTVDVLCPPGTTWEQVKDNKEKISLINERFTDPQGVTKYNLKPIQHISSKRVAVVYGDQGGTDKDGLIELRPGVKGLDLGNKRYAQVRIGVDGTHYLKGVAVYADDLPKGVDIRFNTNKPSSKGKLGVMKKLSDDPDNPFGSVIKKGGQKGYLNIVNEQGDWQEWSKTLSSQFLSKQSPKLAQQQLAFDIERRKTEFEEINSLTNPTIRKYLLDQFANECDTAAIHLKAASMPGQSNSLILPVASMKPNEIFAPNYKNGTKVILIRHPHGGIFELPELTVNNRNKEARKMIGENSTDAVGIHHSVAEQLSGADFDGDTVIVIPNNRRQIVTSKPLEGLKPENFDPKSYSVPEGSARFKELFSMPEHRREERKQRAMGEVSNLITDMTIKGAPEEDLVRAVRHSMVVIDSEKHFLDFKQSAKDNDITGLKRRYQRTVFEDGTSHVGGASTLISRAKSPVKVDQREISYRIDTKTGERIFKETGNTRTIKDKDGTTRVVKIQEEVPKMSLHSNAYDLISSANTTMERIYADYANELKSMARQARISWGKVKELDWDRQAAAKYSNEVKSLGEKLARAKAWSPKERNAQLYANHVIWAKRKENPEMTKDTLQKIKNQAIQAGRARLGGKKPPVEFTDREWEAVQAGAISKTRFNELLRYADQEDLRERSLPKNRPAVSATQIAQARARLRAGYSWEEIARMMDIPKSTLQKAVNG